MNGIGEVFTYRKQDTVNKGYGFYDPNKVFTIEDPNGKIKVDGKLSKIVKEKTNNDNTVIIGGKTYHTVQIGNLIWTVENLELVLSYIPIGSEGNPITPAAWYYDDDESKGWGLLYNQYCLNTISTYLSNNNIDFRIPSNTDWENLKTEIENEAIKVKTVDYWSAKPGTNETGLSIVPGGRRTSTFYSLNNIGFYWSTNTDGSNGVEYHFSYNNDGVLNGTQSKSWAAAIRLVKNA